MTRRPMLALALCLVGSAGAAQPGAVVVETEHGHAAERGGLRPGDLLVAVATSDEAPGHGSSWRVDHPFDLFAAEIEAAGYAVTAQGIREGKAFELGLPAGGWGLETRPVLAGPLLEAYRFGLAEIAGGDPQAGVSGWIEAARQFAPEQAREAAWLLAEAGETLAAEERVAEAREAFETARGLVAEADEAALLASQALAWEAAGRPDLAESSWQELLRRGTQDEEPATAFVLSRLGELMFQQRRLDAAEEHYRRALDIRATLAPDSPVVAQSLLRLGHLAFERRALDDAERHFAESLRLSESFAPGSLLQADAMRGTGNVEMVRGNPVLAAARYRQALAVVESLAPDSRLAARTLSNLGIALWGQGDLAQAEVLFQTALARIEEAAPGSVEHAGFLNNLGIVHHRRFAFGKAAAAYREAAEIFRRVSPDSLELARALTNVALAEGLGGHPQKAIHSLEQVLAIQQQREAVGTDVAYSYRAMGLNYHRLRDFERAEEHYRRALAVFDSLAPGGLEVASTRQGLGETFAAAGDHDQAERELLAALGTFRQLAPASLREAESLYGLATLYRGAGRTDLAADHYRAALEALEAQSQRLGGSDETKASFLERFADYYKDYLALLLELEAQEEAFDVLERYRARALLGMLAERPLRFERDLPPELIASRAELNSEYDQLVAALQRLTETPENVEEIAAAREDLERIRGQRERLAGRIRSVAPRLAALQYPQPLRVARARDVLPPGTLLLSYCVTEAETYLFVLPAADSAGQQPLTVLRLGAGAQALRSDIERLRLLIRVPDAGAQAEQALADLSHSLYQRLIAPAEPLIAGAQRLLIVPDGPLHLLPFAALAAGPPGDRPEYLIERLPIHTAVSLTVYAELRSQGGRAAATHLAAFGDPDYGFRSEPALAETGPAVSRGALQPLPHSRAEVETIGRVFGPASRLYLGPAAREEQAKSLSREVSHVHFASHAVLDERFPLESFLALSTPAAPDKAGDNGLLQAWEVLEQLRLEAELVVLSACETALGAEAGGEGLIGLVRAFHYAGADSVLASLWSVSDRSTADLMGEFYRQLEAGLPKDQALRRAQLSLLRGPALRWFHRAPADFSHPYHWAAFQLHGTEQ